MSLSGRDFHTALEARSSEFPHVPYDSMAMAHPSLQKPHASPHLIGRFIPLHSTTSHDVLSHQPSLMFGLSMTSRLNEANMSRDFLRKGWALELPNMGRLTPPLYVMLGPWHSELFLFPAAYCRADLWYIKPVTSLVRSIMITLQPSYSICGYSGSLLSLRNLLDRYI